LPFLSRSLPANHRNRRTPGLAIRCCLGTAGAPVPIPRVGCGGLPGNPNREHAHVLLKQLVPMAFKPIPTFGKSRDLGRGKDAFNEAIFYNRDLRRVTPVLQQLPNPAGADAGSVQQRHQIECVSCHKQSIALRKVTQCSINWSAASLVCLVAALPP